MHMPAKEKEAVIVQTVSFSYEPNFIFLNLLKTKIEII